jgi:hypothetical protein
MRAELQLSCFKGSPIIRRLGFVVRVGSTRNSVLGYRFDDKPGREVEARFLQGHRTVVIEDERARGHPRDPFLSSAVRRAKGSETMTSRRRFVHLAGAALIAPVLAHSARAQAWPTRPIRAIIPFSAGSTLDVVGRIVLDPLGAALGQSIVVENRGGAGGTIGSALVAKAEPDGYTLLVQASAHSAAPAAYPNIPYDPVRDFAAVIPFGTVPNVTLVAPDKGIRSLAELLAKARAGSLSYASAGVGSATHWAAERLRLAAGFEAVHVPFRGGPEALTEVMTGRVDFTCMGLGGEHAAAFGRLAGGPDHPRSRTARFRLHLLDGSFRAGEHAARRHRAALSGDGKGVAPAGRGGEVQAAGDRALAAVAGRVRCARSQGGRSQHCSRAQGRAEVQLKPVRRRPLNTSEVRSHGIANLPLNL